MVEQITPFELWMAELDGYVWIKCKVSVHDLPDMSFRDWFDSGITAGQASQLVMDELHV